MPLNLDQSIIIKPFWGGGGAKSCILKLMAKSASSIFSLILNINKCTLSMLRESEKKSGSWKFPANKSKTKG